MKSFGIDLSISKTGICVLDELGILHSRIIPTVKGDFTGPGELIRRITVISSTISTLVKQYSPDVITIEGYSMGSKGRVFDLAELGGTVKHMLCNQFNNGARPRILVSAPTTTKAFAGHGKADKDLMSGFALYNYGATFASNDECDAFFLALVGFCYSGQKYGLLQKEWTKKQKDGMEKVAMLAEAIRPRTRSL